jgi:hypothetical protein
MFDCEKDVVAYHDQKVTLPQADRTAMRDRRDSNRERLEKGLAKNDKSAPEEFVAQGSYAMKTMLRDDANDYDIDDGAYFAKEDLVGKQGAEMSSLQARQMVCDALDDGSFDRAPEVRANCVRIFYKKGYHVDMPVYRRVTTDSDTFYELAASSGWKRSDARDVTAWFDTARNNSGDGPRLRHIVRDIKKFSKSRSSWRGRILSGFGITALVVEKCALHSREDETLYYTMKAIRDRLNWDLEVKHPVTPNETITSGPDDAKAKMLRDKLTDALNWLDPLFDDDCTRNEALDCWDKVFNTTFFSERGEEEKRSTASTAALPIASSAAIIGLAQSSAAAVLSSGGGRHA